MLLVGSGAGGAGGLWCSICIVCRVGICQKVVVSSN